MLSNFSPALLAASMLIGVPTTANAETPPDPDRLQVEPMLDARVRFEHVDQSGLEADALTLRLRAGVDARLGAFSLLAEGEGTIAPIDDYNAFPFPLADQSQRRPGYAVVADPENIELNRLQLQYRSQDMTVTLGRQRINLDDQRWVGSVGWRQNEQTFDALRGQASLGPVAVDLTYANDQRTIFGGDAGPRTGLDGDFVFAGASAEFGPIRGKLFAYLLEYDETFFLANSSQSYGGFVSATLPVGATRFDLRASYARQSDYGNNPADYAADYWAVEVGTRLAGFALTAGWEWLGSDNGHAVQTPMATLHKFNGWADLFLTTPPDGLQDAYASIGHNFEGASLLPGLNVNVAYHQFDSAVGDIEYGTEWDFSLGFRLGRVGILAKFADYHAQGFGIDTQKFWLQASWEF